MGLMKWIIRFHGALVTQINLDPEGSGKSEYLLGRAPENDVPLHFDFVSRQHARVYFEDGSWWYQDLREDHPHHRPDPLRLTGEQVVNLENGLELLSEDTLRRHETRIHDRRALGRFRTRRRDDQRKIFFGMFLGFALVGITTLIYRMFIQPHEMNANEVFVEVRPKVVEFVKIKDEKAIRDFKKYAEMKDEDFLEEIGFCTGFLIAPKIVLTANHCLHGTSLVDASIDFRMKSFDGKMHDATRVLGFDIKRDFLFLEVPTLEEYGFLPITESEFKVGQPVFTIGNVSGEGLAIREGITASKTKDLNDPQVEFVRFSAPASGGNSGGPLINAQGEVVALVFAATWDGNYNMGTAAEDLRAAKAKYVDSLDEKTILIEPKRLLNFQPLMIPYQLYLPTLDSAYENPDVFRVFESMSFELKLPATLEEHYRLLVERLNRAAAEKVGEVENRLRQEGLKMKNWSDQLSDEVPMLVFGETSSVFGKLSVEDFDRMKILPQVMNVSMPLAPSQYKNFLQILRSENYFSYIPETQALNLRLDPQYFPDEKDSVIYRTGSFTQREALDRLNYEPFSFYVGGLQSIDGKWEDLRKLDPTRALKILVGDGLLASAFASPYLRPNARRDFLIKNFEEEVTRFTVLDGMNRSWDAFSFRLFGAFTLDTYCAPMPQGFFCQSIIFQSVRPELLKVLRENFMAAHLSKRILPGFFSDLEAISDYQSKNLSTNMPPWNDFDLRRGPDKVWRLGFKHFGLQLELPPQVESVRLNEAAVRGKDASSILWVAHGVEFIERTPSSKLKRRYCEFSFERKDSKTSAVLAAIRADEQTRQREQRRSKGARKSVTEESIWQQNIRSNTQNEDLTLYAYCVPAEKYGDAEQLLNFNFEDRERFIPKFKVY